MKQRIAKKFSFDRSASFVQLRMLVSLKLNFLL